MSNIQFERRVEFSPSHDDRSPNPAENYGIGAVRIWFYLIGPKGAVQWQIGTNWYVPSAQEHLNSLPKPLRDAGENSLGGNRWQPQAWDLGYHSREPRHDWQERDGPSQARCEVLNSPCYYDGSTLAAERLIEPFLREGDKAVWRELEAFYREIFETGDPR